MSADPATPAGGTRPRLLPLLLTIATAYIAVTLNIQGFIAMLPIVQNEFGISRTQAGLYSSFYFLSATLVAIVIGRVVDLLGPRVGLWIGCTAVGVMMLLHGIMPGFGSILVLAFVTGVGFSLITPSVNGGVIQNAPPRKRAGSMGIAHGVGGTGALVGTMLLPAMGERFGWRPVVMVSGIFAIVAGLYISIAYERFRRGSISSVQQPPREQSRGHQPSLREPAPRGTTGAGAGAASSPAGPSFGELVVRLVSHPAFLAAGLMGIAFGMSVGSITGHFALFMNQDLGYSPTVAGFGIGAFHVGGVLGQPSWGVINDRVYRGRRHAGLLTLSTLTAAVSLVFGLVISRGGTPLVVIMGLAFFLGFFVLGTPSLYFTTVSEIAPPEAAGAATGIALVFSRVGVVVGPALYGLAADLTGSYALSWILLALSVLAFAGAGGAVLVLQRQRRTGT